MFARLARAIVILALWYSIGGHWIALQSMAWATMLLDYSQQCSFKQAIVQTFDGAHPCDMCKHVSKGKASEKDPDRTVVAAKADLICVAAKSAPRPPFVSFEYPELRSSFAATVHEPASPPPRTALS